MNLEILLWIVAYVILSEIVFVILLKRSNKEYSFLNGIHWCVLKILSFVFVGVFMLIQEGIVFGNGDHFTGTPHYINLFYELLIIAGITLLFLMDKAISKAMEKKNE